MTTSPTSATCGAASGTRGTTWAGQYTRPYTIYTTGIGWRIDRVPEDIGDRENPYDVFWDTQYSGNMAILDDWHTAMGMVLLRNGIDRHNTDEARHRAGPRRSCSSCATRCTRGSRSPVHRPARRSVRPEPDVVGRRDQHAVLPAGGQSADILRYWFPTDGKGGVDNDLVVCLAQGKNPVAAHVFINYLLDEGIAAGELRLHRLPAAAARVHPGDPGRRRLRPAEPGRATVVTEKDFRPACRCSSCRSRPTWSTTRSGRSSRPVAERDDAAPGNRFLWPLLALPGHRLGGGAVRRADVRRAGDPVRRRRPDPAPAGAGVEPALLGLHPVQLRHASTSSGRTRSSARPCCAPSSTSASRACCAC